MMMIYKNWGIIQKPSFLYEAQKNGFEHELCLSDMGGSPQRAIQGEILGDHSENLWPYAFFKHLWEIHEWYVCSMTEPW